MTLSMVSDEETFGPWGARYLLEHHPEVIGDRCLNAEPSSPAWRRVKKTANVPVSVAQQFVMVAGARFVQARIAMALRRAV
jgi:acetylornithine deacetylase/succinyl-diaminopimelate desuccinylase-like protein